MPGGYAAYDAVYSCPLYITFCGEEKNATMSRRVSVSGEEDGRKPAK